jgi:hypothetical protein
MIDVLCLERTILGHREESQVELVEETPSKLGVGNKLCPWLA